MSTHHRLEYAEDRAQLAEAAAHELLVGLLPEALVVGRTHAEELHLAVEILRDSRNGVDSGVNKIRQQ